MGILLCKVQVLIVFLAHRMKERSTYLVSRCTLWYDTTTYFGLMFSLLRFFWLSQALYIVSMNTSPIGIMSTHSRSYSPA